MENSGSKMMNLKSDFVLIGNEKHRPHPMISYGEFLIKKMFFWKKIDRCGKYDEYYINTCYMIITIIIMFCVESENEKIINTIHVIITYYIIYNN